MVTPSTTTAARRRRLASTSEPSADTNPATIIEPIGEADVIEQIGGKTVAYKAKVTQDETPSEIDNDTEDSDYEGEGFDYEEPPIEVPKEPLALMFEHIREVGQVGETFVAAIIRSKDFMNDGFNSPCMDAMNLPPLQLTADDYFSIVANIQKHNNNSGGRFNIRICRQNGEPLEYYRRAPSIHGGTIPYAIGVSNLLIPNPTREAIAAQTENPNNANNGLGLILQAMQREQREFNERLINTVNKPVEKSLLEKAIEQKLYNDIINPPQNNNGNGLESIMANVMGSIAVTQAMGDALAKSINREPPIPPEPTFIDQMNQVLGNPVVGGLIERASNVIEAVAVAKAENAGTPITVDMVDDDDEEEAAPVMQTATAPVVEIEQQSDAENMKELLLTAITELEGKEALDNTNVALQTLAADYPTEFDNLSMACKNMPYEVILNMILPRLATFEGFDYAAYINDEETKRQNAYIWQPKKGEKMNKRLRELYEYLKALP